MIARLDPGAPERFVAILRAAIGGRTGAAMENQPGLDHSDELT